MAYYFPEGTKIYYSVTFGAAKTVSAITNANPAVATATAHGLTDGTPVLMTSGWEDANDSVFEIGGASTNAFNVVGLDSSNTSWFAAGGGVGTAKAVTSWVEVPQVLSIATQGGGPRNGTIDPLASRNAKTQPIGFEPVSMSLTLGHDASNATYQAMLAITRTFGKVAIKLAIPGGGRIYGFGNLIASEVPSLNKGQVNTVQVALGIDGRVISYGA